MKRAFSDVPVMMRTAFRFSLSLSLYIYIYIYLFFFATQQNDLPQIIS